MAKPANLPTTSLNNWSFNDQHVQQNLVGGDFVGSHSCIVCATAPRLGDLTEAGQTAFLDPNSPQGTDDLGAQFAIPIGVIDSAAIQQDRQMAQIYEIGSKRSYLLAARTSGAMNIARVFYKGPSLLRMLYAYYPPEKMGSAAEDGDTLRLRDHETEAGSEVTKIAIDGKFEGLLPPIKDLPGHNNVIFNLHSDLFSFPYGIVLYFKDNASRDVAAVFLEECYIQNHNVSISANSIIIAENVSMRFERIVPIKVRVQNSAQTAGSPVDTATDYFNQGINKLTGLFD